MTFPVFVPLGPWRLHPHFVFEMAAYAVGFRIFWRAVRRGDVVSQTARLTSLLGAIVGAAIGAKVLAWLEDPPETWRLWTSSPAHVLTGKSLVGALLGGVVGAEIAKRRIGERTKTGDAYVVPLCVAVAIGRIGCFLSGLDDRTCGTATAAPWGLDFGDGVRRHPLPLYESAFMLALAVVFTRRARLGLPAGTLFREFVAVYCVWRAAIDFLKPELDFYFGLGGVQLAALIGLVVFRDGLASLFGFRRTLRPTPGAESE
jgi:phosphatidylglycerol---prolipoprotein diacylglyceryl transferase